MTVRALEPSDVSILVDYWMNASDDHLIGMGVDLDKMPSREQFTNMLLGQLALPVRERQSYAFIWELDGQAIGHCNVNKIIVGQEAYLHLHIWDQTSRQKGLGADLVKATLPSFFVDLELQTLFCEPYALNPAPNKTLEKLGFTLVKHYHGVPGSFSFEQEVNCWELTRQAAIELGILS